jgi:tetratricopeptide (TPR) repeat protein
MADAVAKGREATNEKTRANDRSELAEAVSNFLREDILAATEYAEGVTQGTGADITVVEALDAAATKAGKRFADRPLVEALIRSTLGNSYLELGKLDRAAVQLEESVRLFRRVKGEDDDDDSIRALQVLAWVRHCQGRSAESEQLHADAVRRAERVLGETHKHRLVAYSHYGVCLTDLKKFDLAEPLFHRAIAGHLREGETYNLQMVRSNLSNLYTRQGRFADAEALLRKATAEHRRVRGETHPNTLLLLRNLTNVLCRQKKWEDAEPFARDALTGARKLLGNRPPTDLLMLVLPLDYLGEIALQQGRPDDHHAFVAELLAVIEANPAPLSPRVRRGVRQGANRARTHGRRDQAVRLYELLHRAARAEYQADDPDAVMYALELSGLYSEIGNGPAAVALVDDWLPRARRATDLRLTDPRALQQALGIYERFGAQAKAEPLLRERVEAAKLKPGTNSPQYLLGVNLMEQEKWADAEKCLRDCRAIGDIIGPNSVGASRTTVLLGGCLVKRQQYPEAEQLLLKGYEGMKAREKTIPPQGIVHIPEAIDWLIKLYTATGRPDEAARWRAEQAKYPNVAPPPRAKK